MNAVFGISHIAHSIDLHTLLQMHKVNKLYEVSNSHSNKQTDKRTTGQTKAKSESEAGMLYANENLEKYFPYCT